MVEVCERLRGRMCTRVHVTKQHPLVHNAPGDIGSSGQQPIGMCICKNHFQPSKVTPAPHGHAWCVGLPRLPTLPPSLPMSAVQRVLAKRSRSMGRRKSQASTTLCTTPASSRWSWYRSLDKQFGSTRYRQLSVTAAKSLVHIDHRVAAVISV